MRSQPKDQLAILGGTARFSVMVEGIGPFSYQWFKGAAPISGATSDTLVLENLVAGDFTPSSTGSPKYSVQVTNAHSTITSTAAGLYQDSLGSGLPNWWRQQYFASETSDLWDVSQGTVITSSTAGGTGDLRNILGGSFSSPEAGTAFFTDSQGSGYAHAIEFECPTSVSVAGYRLKLGDDTVSGNRGISEFRLYFYNTTTSSFQLIDTYVPPAHPYGPLQGASINFLETTRSITPISATRFRAEFVQHASPPYGGPRVIELDAISATGPTVSAIADSDGDGVINSREYTDGTNPTDAASRNPRVILSGPTALIHSETFKPTYPPEALASFSGHHSGELQFGGFTGSYRSKAQFGMSFDMPASAADVFLKGLFGSMPVQRDGTAPVFTYTDNSPASVTGFATSTWGSWIAWGNFDRVNGLSRIAAARFASDDTLDTSFVPQPNGQINGAVILPGGQVLLAGFFSQMNGQPRPGVAKFGNDGLFDTTFTPNFHGSGSAFISCLAVQGDGKILLGGDINDGSTLRYLVRLNADGSTDATLTTTTDSAVKIIAQQADGKILVGGNFTTVNSTATPKLVRLNLDGTLDGSFSLVVANGAVTSEPKRLIVQPDGKILVGGNVQVRLNGSTVNVPLARLNADGTLDSAFTQKVHALAAGLTFADITRHSDGRIVGVGTFTLASPSVVNAVRFKVDGSVDPDCFVISRPNGPLHAVAAQVNDELLMGGAFSDVRVDTDAGNGHNYFFTQTKSGWHAAQAMAAKLGGNLASISGPTENRFIVDTMLPLKALANYPVWTGFSDHGVEGLWQWSNGDPASYTIWNPGEPSNFGGEDHGMVNWAWARNGGNRYHWDDTLDGGTVGFGGNSDGPYHGIIEVDPAALPASLNHWVAGRDLIANEQAGSTTELTNPNATVPQWSYGTRSTQTSGTNELNLYIPSEHSNSPTTWEGWTRAPGYATVGAVTPPQGIPGGIRQNEIIFHPPPSGFSVVRWTAPVGGLYSVTALWQDADWSGGDGSNASVVKNGTTVVFNSDFDNGNGAFTNQTLSLSAGDTLDFLLGIRANDTADTTRFNASVTLIQNASDVWVGGRDLTANEKPDGHANETTNPNATVPQWSYGARSTLVTSGIDMALTHINTALPGDDAMEGWKNGDAAILSNTGTTPFIFNFGFGPNIPFNPDELLISPDGHAGPFPVVRWTAPAAGRYEIFAYWQDIDFHGGNGLSGHIVVNGGQIYGQDMDNAHGCSVAQSLDLKAGDRVDFTMGTRGDYTFDTTKFNVVIVRPAASAGHSITPGTLTLATSRADIEATAIIDWANAAPNNTDIAGNPFVIESSTGVPYYVRKDTTGSFKRLNQGAGWAGNFAPGDAVLNHGNSDGPVIIEAASRGGLFSAIGMQIQANQDGPFTATIRAYDMNGGLLGTHTVNGTSNANADNSAIFIGVKSTAENIHAISVDTNSTAWGGDFAINRVSIQATNAAAGNELSNLRTNFARLVPTNSALPLLFYSAGLQSIFATGAPASLQLTSDVTSGEVNFAMLEASADGTTFQPFSNGTTTDGETWSFPVTAVPPGQNYYRAMLRSNKLEQARSHALTLTAPPVVTSPLAVVGEVGQPFSYTGTATGKLTAFNASSLPAWATATFDANSNTLRITGTPSTGGESSSSIQPANAAGSTAATLVINIGSPFSSWQTAYFTAGELLNPAISGPLGDATGAGITNLMKYALGIPPRQPGVAGMPTGDVEDYGANDYLTLVYTRDKSAQGLAYTVEVSGDLITWQSGPSFTTEVSRIAQPNNRETVIVRDNVAASSGLPRFIRLKVTQ